MIRMYMTPEEKAWSILVKINNQDIKFEEWNETSKLAKNDLKRKAKIVVEEIVEELGNWTGGPDNKEWDIERFDYWIEVLRQIKKI